MTWALVAWSLGGPLPPLEGQDIGRLAAACGEGRESLLAWCQETALAAQAAQTAEAAQAAQTRQSRHAWPFRRGHRPR